MFPAAEVIDVDEVGKSHRATARNGSALPTCGSVEDTGTGYFDLIHMNEVFHHIRPGKVLASQFDPPELVHPAEVGPSSKSPRSLGNFENKERSRGRRGRIYRKPYSKTARQQRL
jgi:hypothetical protein